MRNIPVRRMVLEEFRLALPRVVHTFLHIDILLTAIHGTYEPEFERVNSAGEDVECIGPCVHEVQFSKNSDCTATLRINTSGEF